MIVINNLQKVINQQTAVNIDRLSISEGEITALIGPADSGIGVLQGLLTGRMRPTLGSIVIDGHEITANPSAFSALAGVMFAEDSVYTNQTSRANLRFQCSLYNLPASRADEVLVQVGLADQSHTRVSKLPPELIRRLAFGRAILHRPRALLLIEPFTRCDEPTLDLLQNLITMQAAEHTSVLILTADATHLRALCDSIYMLSRGHIVDTFQPDHDSPSVQPFRIPIRTEGKVILVNPAEILFVSAQDGRAILHTHTNEYPTQFTLSDMDERLSRGGFFRAHRSYLVNLQHLTEVIPYTRNSYSIRLNGGVEIPLSKAAAAELRELLGF